MQDHLRIEVRNEPGAGILALRGELDLASSEQLDEELERLIEAHSEQVIVDLTELEFMDSTGLSVLVKAHQRAEDVGTRLTLVKGRPQVQRLLSLTRVAERIDVGESVSELLSRS